MTQQTPGGTMDEVLRVTLDRHGYGFQYAVIRKIKEIFEQPRRQHVWTLEAAEFPVATGSVDTRVDFIVRPNGTRFFLVVECKRANPAFSNWCFVKAPFVRRGENTRLRNERLYVEHAVAEIRAGRSDDAPSITSRGTPLRGTVPDVFHLGFEVKQPRGSVAAKGDAQPTSNKNPIEEAAGQVLRGVNGLVNTLPRISMKDWQNNFGPRVPTTLMPAIFTTAKLWTSSADIGSADLTTGKLPEGLLDPVETPWLFFQYAISPSLRNQHSVMTPGYEFSDLLPESLRTIAIVNANGIENFFREFQGYGYGVEPWTALP